MSRRLSALIEEKKLLFEQKLELIKALKGTLALLGVLLGAIYGAGAVSGADARQAHVAVPFLIVLFGSYMLVNSDMLNRTCVFLEVIDTAIDDELGGTPETWSFASYQTLIGQEVRGRTWFIRAGTARVMDPYRMMSMVGIAIGVGTWLYSLLMGFEYIYEHSPRWAWIFGVAAEAVGIGFAVCAAFYIRNRQKVAEELAKHLAETTGTPWPKNVPTHDAAPPSTSAADPPAAAPPGEP